MFTGITEEIGKVTSAHTGSLVIAAKDVLQGISHGASMAVNGVCLTVTEFNANSFTVGVMQETLKRTNLGLLRVGDEVNLERPLALGGPLGGHLVQGHVDDTGKVASMTRDGDTTIIRFTTPPEVMRFIVTKGFITIDGISLTVVDKVADSFRVSVVDYTRKNTTLGNKQAGDRVNLEIDIIAKYVAQFSQVQGTGITADFLQEHGFPVN
ncbi:riboflavin synthase [Chloroflexota bacterium]